MQALSAPIGSSSEAALALAGVGAADAALTTLAAALILVLAGTAEATTLTLIALLTGVDTAEAALSLLGGPALAVTLALPSALLVLVLAALAATLALLALAGVRATDTALTTLAAALVLVLAGAAEATALALVALLAGIGTAEAALAPLALALLALLALLVLAAAEAAALLPLVLSAELSGVVLFSHDGTPIVSVGRTPTEQSARDRNVMRGVGRTTSAQVGPESRPAVLFAPPRTDHAVADLRVPRWSMTGNFGLTCPSVRRGLSRQHRELLAPGRAMNPA